MERNQEIATQLQQMYDLLNQGDISTVDDFLSADTDILGVGFIHGSGGLDPTLFTKHGEFSSPR